VLTERLPEVVDHLDSALIKAVGLNGHVDVIEQSLKLDFQRSKPQCHRRQVSMRS